jgi:hypothetical protein
MELFSPLVARFGGVCSEGGAMVLYLCWNIVGARKSLGFLYRWLG